MIIRRVLIMQIGETQNGFILTKEMVLNSLDTFTDVPIVYNEKQSLKDYRDNKIVNKFNKEYAIGVIVGNIEVTDKEVFADINIWDKYLDKWKGKYDNWCIQFDDDEKSKFKLCSIECF